MFSRRLLSFFLRLSWSKRLLLNVSREWRSVSKRVDTFISLTRKVINASYIERIIIRWKINKKWFILYFLLLNASTRIFILLFLKWKFIKIRSPLMILSYLGPRVWFIMHFCQFGRISGLKSWGIIRTWDDPHCPLLEDQDSTEVVSTSSSWCRL